jgi:hypothetical protein
VPHGTLLAEGSVAEEEGIHTDEAGTHVSNSVFSLALLLGISDLEFVQFFLDELVSDFFKYREIVVLSTATALMPQPAYKNITVLY